MVLGSTIIDMAISPSRIFAVAISAGYLEREAIMDRIYLSRRNLLTLLSKLDRQKNGETTACTLIKFNERPAFKNSMESCEVIAIEDDKYYVDFSAGMVHPSDDPNNKPKL